MHVQVEFLGVSRLATGLKEVALDLEKGTTFRDIVHMLATRYPTLIGDVVQANGETLQAPNILNLNGKRMIQENQMDEGPSDGDRIIFMSMSAGG